MASERTRFVQIEVKEWAPPGQPRVTFRLLRTLPPTHELLAAAALTCYAIWKAVLDGC